MRRSAGETNATRSRAEISLFRVPQIIETRDAVRGACRRDAVLSQTCRAGWSWWWRARPASRPGSSLHRRCSSRSCSARSPPRVYNPRRRLSAGASQRLEVQYSAAARSPACKTRTRLLGAPAQRRRAVHHQCRHQHRPGRAARRRHRVHLRPAGHFHERIEAKTAVLQPAALALLDARRYAL